MHFFIFYIVTFNFSILIWFLEICISSSAKIPVFSKIKSLFNSTLIQYNFLRFILSKQYPFINASVISMRSRGYAVSF